MFSKKINGVPAKKIFILLFLFIASFCFAMFQGGFVSWFIFFMFLPFLLYSILLVFIPIKIQSVHRTIKPERVIRGNKVIVTVTCENQSYFPIALLSLREKMKENTFDYQMEDMSENLFLVGFKRNFEWQYEMRNVQRGELIFEGLEITITDFFGWIERKIFLDKRDLLIVYPKQTMVDGEQFSVLYDQGNTNVSKSLVRDTSIVTGVRKYEEGDRFSWIHWKSFAKTGELRTKEFENIEAQNLVLFLDRSRQLEFELTVDLTASFLKLFVQKRADISFFTFSDKRKLFPLIKTDSQYESVLQYLAVTQMEQGTKLIENAINAEYQIVHNSIVIVVTSRDDDEIDLMIKNGSKVAKRILCFVVVSEKKLKAVDRHQHTGNLNRKIYISESMFSQALTEVRK